jgi:hypothetical protein
MDAVADIHRESQGFDRNFVFPESSLRRSATATVVAD